MPARLSERQRIYKAIQPAVSLFLIGGLLASCTYTQSVYELDTRPFDAPLTARDIQRACSIIDQIAAQERLQRVPSNDMAVIRLYRQQTLPIPAPRAEARLVLRRTTDENLLSCAAWLNQPGSNSLSRRLGRRVFERFESEFGSNRVLEKTHAIPMPTGY